MAKELESGMVAASGTLDRMFAGPFGYLAGRVTLSSEAASPAIPLARLLERQTFGPVLDRYADRFGEADRRSVASLWSQYCFGNLIVPFVVLSLLDDRMPPASLETVRLALEDGLPSGLDLPHIGRRTASGDAFERFEPLIRRVVEPLIRELAGYSGASPRLFWGNAAATLDWAIQEASAVPPGRADRETLQRQILDSASWPDGEANPLFGALRPASGPAEERRRRVCCVRYPLPGVPGCGSLCPLDR